ncbi:MAG: vanadium-dependent haloperoxidase [Gammaproteobacteria bacterium]|nr:vanadium-dependent haloperoxidase [Gammaproteobacteria bacterium]
MRKVTLQLTLVTALLLGNAWAWADTDYTRKSADEFSSDVASTWFEQLYDIVKAEETAPPPASRIYGITAVALYEALVAGTKTHRPLARQLNGLTSMPRPKQNKRYHWPTVANTVLARTIRGLYPAMSKESLRMLRKLKRHIASLQSAMVSKQLYRRSAAHGRAVTRAILDWAATDGFASHNECPYFPLSVPGAWEPTPPLFSPSPAQPCWGLIRPMVLISGEECAAPGHPAFSTDVSSDFFAAALEVYETGTSLSADQKTIADYWADGAGATGTPPGHWIAIVSQIAREDDLSLAAAAEAYARVGIAVHDAFIACWSAKYLYNVQRPVTYINDHIDAYWAPYTPTPGFPSYTSGHSAQSAAAARVLTDMFGIKSLTDTTHSDHGLVPAQKPRTFGSFDQAATEAAASRLYGGIHYPFDNDDGLAAGQCIGQTIVNRVRFKDDDD